MANEAEYAHFHPGEISSIRIGGSITTEFEWGQCFANIGIILPFRDKKDLLIRWCSERQEVSCVWQKWTYSYNTLHQCSAVEFNTRSSYNAKRYSPVLLDNLWAGKTVEESRMLYARLDFLEDILASEYWDVVVRKYGLEVLKKNKAPFFQFDKTWVFSDFVLVSQLIFKCLIRAAFLRPGHISVFWSCTESATLTASPDFLKRVERCTNHQIRNYARSNGSSCRGRGRRTQKDSRIGPWYMFSTQSQEDLENQQYYWDF